MTVKKPLKKLRRGLWQAVWGTVVGFGLTAVAGLFVRLGIFPDYALTILAGVNLISGLLMLRATRRWGVTYTAGWLAGSAVFAYLGVMETLGIVLNIAAPAVILLWRLAVAVRKGARQAFG